MADFVIRGVERSNSFSRELFFRDVCACYCDTSLQSKLNCTILYLHGWRRRQFVHPKPRYLPTSPQGITAQKTNIDIKLPCSDKITFTLSLSLLPFPCLFSFGFWKCWPTFWRGTDRGGGGWTTDRQPVPAVTSHEGCNTLLKLGEMVTEIKPGCVDGENQIERNIVHWW